MKSEIKKELTKKRLDDEKRATLQSMILCLDGLEAYSSSLSKKPQKMPQQKPIRSAAKNLSS